MTDVGELVDHLFRREAGRLVAALTRSLGPAHLALAEEVVQDALVRALRLWPYRGVPDRPAGWLYRVARNLALDRLRRDASFRHKENDIRRGLPEAGADVDPRDPGELTDDQLRLIFLCCHPEVPRDGRVALTLKVVCGFGVAEIARGFLAKPATVAQRIVRAQRVIRDRGLPYEVPGPDALPERLDAVLEVVYLTFNEGYAAGDGDRLVRRDVCHEALRLVDELARLDATNRPVVHALAALLLFQASRLDARVDERGELVLLDDQDRACWDRRAIARAFVHLGQAARGDDETPYHLQAAIAAQHAAAVSPAATDWRAIVGLYDRLLASAPSPIVALNRAVAVARVHGAARGLAEVERIGDDPALADYALLYATRADLLERAGRADEAGAAWRRALDCPCSEPEARYLRRRLALANRA